MVSGHDQKKKKKGHVSVYVNSLPQGLGSHLLWDQQDLLTLDFHGHPLNRTV